MQSQGNIRVVEMLRYLYQHTDENHPATVTDITAYLKERGIQAVRQTVYADLNALITAGFDIVIVKSTQNQYFMGNRLFEYPELKMLADAVASSKIISAKKSEALVQKLGCLTSIHQAEQLKGLASLSSRVKPGNEKVYYIIDSIHSAMKAVQGDSGHAQMKMVATSLMRIAALTHRGLRTHFILKRKLQNQLFRRLRKRKPAQQLPKVIRQKSLNFSKTLRPLRS